MNFELDPELKRIQETARELAADFATRAARDDQELSSPDENYTQLKQAGFYRFRSIDDVERFSANVMFSMKRHARSSNACPNLSSTKR